MTIRYTDWYEFDAEPMSVQQMTDIISDTCTTFELSSGVVAALQFSADHAGEHFAEGRFDGDVVASVLCGDVLIEIPNGSLECAPRNCSTITFDRDEADSLFALVALTLL